MIVTEQMENNRILHYSDSGFRILQNETGIVYDDAVDVLPCRYTYSETEEQTEGDELTDSQALYILTGGAYGEA
jgi:hypothetical protein